MLQLDAKEREDWEPQQLRNRKEENEKLLKKIALIMKPKLEKRNTVNDAFFKLSIPLVRFTCKSRGGDCLIGDFG